MLTMLDLDPSHEGAVESLATNIVLPSNVDSIESAKSVIVIREGKAIVVLRVLEGDGSGFVLQKDGLKYNAMRYTVYHYRGESKKLTEKHVRVGLLAYATTCTSEKECAAVVESVKSAQIESHSDGHTWSVKARLGSTELAAARDLDHRTILSRAVNGKPFAAQYPLSINGKPVELK